MKKTVFNKKTGEAATVDSIDAKEYLESGGWSPEKCLIGDMEAGIISSPDSADKGDPILSSSGGPYASKSTAENRISREGWEETHEAREYEDGWAVYLRAD